MSFSKDHLPAKQRIAIFDIDGTLTDTVALHQRCLHEALIALGIEDINTGWGGYRHHTDAWILHVNYYRQFNKSVSKDIETAFSHDLTKRLHDYSNLRVEEIAGARNFVEYLLHETDIAVVFATGAYYEAATYKLEHSRIPFVPGLVASSYHGLSREDVVLNAIASAATFYGVDVFSTQWSFGDGLWDWLTAQTLGLDFIGLATGQREHELRTAGAEHLFPDYSSIESILQKMAGDANFGINRMRA